MDEPRVSRRRFLGDFAFLGAGLLASVAWAWAHHESPVETKPTPSPSASTSPKVRTPEFDHPPMPGEAVYIPPTQGTKPGCK